jgi:hypothetical protein
MGFMAKHATINIKHVNIASLNSLKDHKKIYCGNDRINEMYRFRFLDGGSCGDRELEW